MRIISGEARGRKIETIDGLSTRPTSEKIREAIFGSIQFEIADAVFLDVFSGSGAMALEAISRGAKKAVCNDSDPKCIEIMVKNANFLGFSDRVEVKRMDFKDLFRTLEKKEERFDVVFIDPPYGSGYIAKCMECLMENNVLNYGARIIIEHNCLEKVDKLAEIHKGLVNTNEKKYGDTYVSYFQFRGV